MFGPIMVKTVAIIFLFLAVLTSQFFGDKSNSLRLVEGETNSARSIEDILAKFSTQNMKDAIYHYVYNGESYRTVVELAFAAYEAVSEAESRREDDNWKKFVNDTLQTITEKVGNLTEKVGNLTEKVGNLTEKVGNLTEKVGNLTEKVNYHLGSPPDEEETKISAAGSDFSKCSQTCKRSSVSRTGTFRDTRIEQCCSDNYRYNSGFCMERIPICKEPKEDATHRNVPQCDHHCDKNHAITPETIDVLGHCCEEYAYPRGKCDEEHHAICWHFE